MFAILNCVDVYVDACVRNEAGQLMFMSVFGRDTATRELMARIQLASGQDSLRELTLQGYGPYKGQKHTVQVADAKELDKLTGRLPKGLYGELTHVWIFHPSIKGVDKGAKRAWIIEHGQSLDQDMLKTRVWQTVCELADIPLLQHWREPVLRQIWDSMVFEMGKTNPDPNTGAGKKVSTGAATIRVMKPGRDTMPFVQITTALGRDPYNTPVSCWIPAYVGGAPTGWGGAMGPAQFIASTWNLFADRLQSLLGATADPWGIKDSFTAAGLYLANLGASAQTTAKESNAASRYYGGSSAYARSVMSRASCIQTFIDSGTMSTSCQNLIF